MWQIFWTEMSVSCTQRTVYRLSETQNTKQVQVAYIHLWLVGRLLPITKFLVASRLVPGGLEWAWQSNQCDCRNSLISSNHESLPQHWLRTGFLSCSLFTNPAPTSLVISGVLGVRICCVLQSQQHLQEVDEEVPGSVSPCWNIHELECNEDYILLECGA
jgi:hypothetical protein